MPKRKDKEHLRTLRETWSEVNTDGMTSDNASIYKNRKLAVDLYIDGASMSDIVASTHISKARICQLVDRCATASPDTGEMFGYSALIFGKTLAVKQSKIEAFFEENPEIEKVIKGCYLGDKAYTNEHRMNLRTLHGIFIKECRKAGIQDYQFPFSTQSCAYESLRVYINKFRDENMNEAIRREGKDRMQTFLSTGYGVSYKINPRAPFDIVQIDGHILDVLSVVRTTDTNGETVTDIATRVWLIAIIDVATRCIIGYSVSPHYNYNQFDVLQAIQNSIVPHQHEEFKLKSLNYPQNGGFPSEAVPETKWAGFNTIMLDNAKAHLASKVVDKLTNQLGCVVNFGSVATPETRGIVERFFGTLERSGFHRMPNTTGSNVRDLKRKDAEKYAKEIKLTYEDICEIIESLIAEYNNSAHSALNGYTPLELLASKVRNARMPYYVVPQGQRESIRKLSNFTVECTLRGGLESGRQLYIQYEGARYHPVDLRIPMSMKNEKVLIEVDPEDLRLVKMFRKDGSFFCDMIAVGEYGRVKHSLKTRRMANKARKERMTPDSIFNPDISRLTEELVERGKKDRRSRTKAATIVREASGALDPKGPSDVIEFQPEPRSKPLRKAVGETPRDKRELSIPELEAIVAKYQGDVVAAIEEVNRLSKG